MFCTFPFSAYACIDGAGVTVNCYDCEAPEDLAEALEAALPSSQFLNVRFTLSQLRVVLHARVLGRYIPVGGGPIPVDKNCGEDWDQVADNLNIDWDLVDVYTDHSGGGDASIPLPVGGFGDDPMGCSINETTTVMQTITACDSNGQNCITWTVPLRTTRTVMAPGC